MWQDRTIVTVDEYLEAAPEPQRGTLIELRQILRNLLPHSSEGLSYGVPAFKVEGRPVAGYAYFKNHCSYFPHSGSVLPQLAGELTGYEWSRGTLKFGIDTVIPKALVARLVETKLAELNG
jgi:uncharacterized protein YdhG (YjbR/CyaY superfamily)